MITQRSKKRHAGSRRLVPGVLAILLAAAAVTLGSGTYGQGDEPQDIHRAMAMGGPGGGAAGGETGPPGQAGGATGGASAGSQSDAGATPPAGTGKGSGEEDDFLPNGENGLMLLADHAAGKGPKDHVPGAGDGPTGGETGAGPQDGAPGLPGTDSFQVAENDTQDSGLGVGGRGFSGGGGGGGAGGGGGGGGGGGDNPGGTVSKPSPGETPPAQTVTPPSGGGEGGDNPVCVLSSGCDLTPPDPSSPPKATEPTDGDLPGLPPRGEQNVGESGAIPEPASWLMMITGFLGLGAVLRAQRRKAELA